MASSMTNIYPTTGTSSGFLLHVSLSLNKHCSAICNRYPGTVFVIDPGCSNRFRNLLRCSARIIFSAQVHEILLHHNPIFHACRKKIKLEPEPDEGDCAGVAEASVKEDPEAHTRSRAVGRLPNSLLYPGTVAFLRF
jgi:hypothetical protein